MINYRLISYQEASSESWPDTPYCNIAKGAIYIGAFDADRLVGLAAFKLTGNTIKLCSAMVQPEYRRRGIYSQLFAIRAREIAAIPHTKEVSYCTDRSLGMYLNNGFKIVKQYKHSTKVERWITKKQ